MEHKLLVLCDPEEDYAQHMAEFLCKRKEAGWEVIVYTKPEELEHFKKDIEVLLIAESVYGEFVKKLSAKLVVLLNESGVINTKGVLNIDKYQEAEKVHRALWSEYLELEQETTPVLMENRRAKFIGMYSPIRRCLQTTFALTYGQLMAEKHPTLYLSFEYYGGYAQRGDCVEDGLGKLLYYLPEERGLQAHIKAVTNRIGGLDYITPMINGQNLLFVTGNEWTKLLYKIAESGAYEYIILDLSESIQGLFDILQMCERIYTIEKDDVAAKSKILQYEQLLSMQKLNFLRERTSKCSLPLFRKLPGEIEQYTKGALADYVKELIHGEAK